MRIPASQYHGEILNGRIPHLDVGRNRVVKHHHMLVDQRHGVGKLIRINLVDRFAIEQNLSLPWAIEACHQFSQSTLATTRRANQRYALSGFQRNREVLDLRIGIPVIAKGHMTQLQPATQFTGTIRTCLLRALLCRITQHILHPLHLRAHLDDHLTRRHQVADRGHEAGQETLKGHQHTDRELTIHDQIDPNHQDQVAGKCLQHLRENAKNQVAEAGAHLRIVHIGEVTGPMTKESTLRSSRLDGLHVVETRHRHAIVFTGIPLRYAG